MAALDAYHSKQMAYADLHTLPWARFITNFMASLNGEHSGSTGSPGSIRTWGRHPDGVTSRLARQLNMAENFYVSPLMCRLVSAAAEDWPEDEPVMPEDFFVEHGWLFIPGGITVLDIRGQLIVTSGISWEVIGGKAYVAMWVSKVHDLGYAGLPGWDELPTYTPWHLTHIDLGHPIGKTLRMGTLLPPEVSQQIKYIPNEDNKGGALYFPQGWTPEQLKPSMRPDEVLAWLISTLRIMQTTLAATTRTGLPANVRRASRKERWQVKQTAVTVIELRHRAKEFGSGGEREYSHRWLRRGHWRKQWYGSERTNDRRQVRIWIHPSLCGPEGAPLLLREHVNSLVR